MSRRQRLKRRAEALPGVRVLGLDVSSVCVGWAIFENGEPVEYGKYRQKGVGHGEKLLNFEAWLVSHLEAVDPAYLIVEAPFAGRRRYAFGVLMMYFAVVLLVHVRWCGAEMPPGQRVQAHLVKRELGAKKGTSHEQRKRMMVQLINKLYGLNLKFKSGDQKKAVSDDDVADAIALVRAWLLRGGPTDE